MRISRVLSYFVIGLSTLSAVDKPNIVFLLTDDQATISVGCYGNDEVLTPNIDSLADQGLRFLNHYDTTAICMASRASIVTGKYEYKTGCNFEHGELDRSIWQKSYPMLLREAGYRTAIAGKIGFEVSEEPGGKGSLPEDDFDAWGAGPGQTTYDTAKNKSMAKYAKEYPHSTLSYGAFGRDFIEQAARDKVPFCLSISFKAPHMPATPDPRFDDVYKGKTFTKPANYGREAGEHFSLQSQQGRQYERFYSWNYADKYDQVMATYYQQIYGVDVAVGMILDALKEYGVSENTVVIFTSDNGFLNGSHGYGSKVLPYEEASRVPLLIFDPRNKHRGKKQTVEALTGNIDFAPTIMELAGVKVPNSVDGKSLVSLLDDPKGSVHEYLTLINVWGPAQAQSLSVVTRDEKYIYWPWAAKGFEPTSELYLTKEDPLELVNQINNPEQASKLRKMQALYTKALDHWNAEAVDYNNYQPYGKIFDPDLSWDKKAGLFKK
jgi:arylsulfatase A-like enzyme